jgi:hypothetical protein
MTTQAQLSITFARTFPTGSYQTQKANPVPEYEKVTGLWNQG